MHRVSRFTSTLASLALTLLAVAPATAAIPGDYLIHRMPECDIAAEGEICRQTVPNGDFEGFRDDYWHGEFRWFGASGKRHSIEAHLAPWTFSGPSALAYTTPLALFNGYRNTDRTLRLALPGDRVEQFIQLPQADREDFIYTIHAHVGSEAGPAQVLMRALLGDGQSSAAAIEMARATSGHLEPGGAPTDEFIASVLVKAGSGVRYAGLSFDHVSGAPVRVDDIVIVRSIPGQIPVDPFLATTP
ncbi:MAG: hypothetical protein ABWZ85_08960 [Luteibacter sp.]